MAPAVGQSLNDILGLLDTTTASEASDATEAGHATADGTATNSRPPVRVVTDEDALMPIEMDSPEGKQYLDYVKYVCFGDLQQAMMAVLRRVRKESAKLLHEEPDEEFREMMAKDDR